MIYIYNDYGGTHTTSLAAAYHLNKLPTNHQLTTEEILNVNYFNQLDKSDAYRFIFHGKDEDSNPVYTIGRRRSKYIVPTLECFYLLLQDQIHSDEKIIFSNTSPTVPFTMTMGGFLSRGLKVDSLGVPLLVNGAKKCCQIIHQLVEETKEAGKSTNESVLILDNKQFKL